MPTMTLTVPDDAGLGPKMKALNPQQRTFVYALVECGGSATQAAAAAGYGADSDTRERRQLAQRVTGYRLSHDEGVLAAIREEAERRLQASVLLAASELVKMAKDPDSKHQYKAAVALLDRGGMQLVARQDVHVHHSNNDQEVRAEILEMCRQLGLDPKKLLGAAAGPVTDAEFEPVISADVAESADGLEDLL